MRKNFETLDVDKIQERWYLSLISQRSVSLTLNTGAVEINLGFSGRDGRNYLRISVMSNRRNLTHRE